MITTLHGWASLLTMLAWPPRLFDRLFALPWYRGMLEDWLAPHLAKWPASSGPIIELGCAAGGLTGALASAGWPVIGVDRARHMLRRAVRQAPVVQADGLHLPLATGSAQLVVAASLLNVVTDPLALLREMARVSRPGGTVSVLVPNTGFPRSARLALAQRLPAGFPRAALHAWARLARSMTLAELNGLFRQAGLMQCSHQILLDGMVLTVSSTRQQALCA